MEEPAVIWCCVLMGKGIRTLQSAGASSPSLLGLQPERPMLCLSVFSRRDPAKDRYVGQPSCESCVTEWVWLAGANKDLKFAAKTQGNSAGKRPMAAHLALEPLRLSSGTTPTAQRRSLLVLLPLTNLEPEHSSTPRRQGGHEIPTPQVVTASTFGDHRGCWAPTNLAFISLPGQEAAASASVPDTDLARAGATVEQGAGPVAE